MTAIADESATAATAGYHDPLLHLDEHIECDERELGDAVDLVERDPLRRGEWEVVATAIHRLFGA